MVNSAKITKEMLDRLLAASRQANSAYALALRAYRKQQKEGTKNGT